MGCNVRCPQRTCLCRIQGTPLATTDAAAIGLCPASTLHLPYVSPASRMQRMRSPARVVTVAEPLSLVSETTSRDRGSRRGGAHADPRKRGDAGEIVWGLSRSAAVAARH